MLVAGSTGYIGAHTCKALNRGGYIPVTYDNLFYGHEEFVKWGPFEYGDSAILLGDSTKAMNELGWMPKYGDIEIILSHAWAWHKKIMNSNK